MDTQLMNASASASHPGMPPGDENSVERDDLKLDAILAVDAVEEALDVAFLAIAGAQQTARSFPDAVSPDRVLKDWRLSTVLLRQALRLIDERVQDLAETIKRLPRSG